jgi:hypothetical protein
MKKCLPSISIKEMQIKTTLTFQLTGIRMATSKNTNNNKSGEDMEKRGPSYTVGGNVNLYSYYGKQYGGSS